MTKTKNKLVPRLRFPEFRDKGDWIPKTIGSVCKTYSGGTPATTQKKFYGGDIPFIRSAEIDKDNTELLLTPEGLFNSAAKLISKGDVLVALYGANSGDVALAKIDGAINQAILCLKSEDSNAFIYQYLSHIKNWIISTYIQGGQGNLSGEIIKSIELCFPTQGEQQKIAECLSSLDELIAAQVRKVETLKTYKRGLMQQFFPREGETVPRLRFPEFRDKGEWKKVELKEISNLITKGTTPTSLGFQFEESGIHFIKIESIEDDGKINLSKVAYISKDCDDAIKRSRLEENDILFSIAGALGVVAIVKREVLPANTNQALAIIRLKHSYSHFYLTSFLKSPSIQSEIEKIKAGAAQLNISLSQLGSFLVMLPEDKEQQKIAECLSSLDDKITAESEKLEALKKHKKGLMQQLFPSPEDVSAS